MERPHAATSTEPRPPEAADAGSAAREAVAVAALPALLAMYAYFWIRLYRDYLLIRDDPANIGGTVVEGLRGWLTRGMADYYHVYPEWAQSGFSDFYRPVWHLIIYVEHAVLGSHYWAWFLVFYAVQFLGALLFLRVLRFLGVPSRPAAFVSLCFLFNPAFVNLGLVYPGFQFDVVASLLLLASFFLLLKHRFAPALLLITAAVFTKETALFAPLAAAATVFVLKRDPRWCAAMLAPLFAWGLARWLAFHTVLGGTFESPTTLRELLGFVAKGMVIWPSGAVPENFGDRLSDGGSTALLILFLLNGVLWLFLAYAAWNVAHRLRREPQGKEAKLQAVLLIWLLGALSFCILVRPQTRLGAGLYVFLFLFTAHFLFVNFRPGVARIAPLLLLACLTLFKSGVFLWRAVADVSAERAGEKALYAGLRSLPQDGSRVFIVNAPSMLATPRYLVEAWKLRRDIVFVNQFQGCRNSQRADARYDLSPAALSIENPACAIYIFAGAERDFLSKGLRGDLARPGIGTYRFPDAGHHPAVAPLHSWDIDFGRRLEIRFALPRERTVLAYDWRTQTYRVLAARPER